MTLMRNATDLDGAFETAKNWRADALIVLSNPLSLTYRTRIADIARNAGLPTIYLYRPHVSAGGLRNDPHACIGRRGVARRRALRLFCWAPASQDRSAAPRRGVGGK